MNNIFNRNQSIALAQAPHMEHAEAVSVGSSDSGLRKIADDLIARELAAELGAGAMLDSVRHGHAAMLSHLRNVAALEGRVLEMLIAEIAKSRPGCLVLREGVTLPVTQAALELVERNSPQALAPLSLSADHATRRGYAPDLLIVDRTTGAALLIDVKRTVASYDAGRLVALKRKMLAAALTVPDYLYQEHARCVVSTVDVAILAMDNRKSDTEHGVWPLSRLDELLGVPGATDAVSHLRKTVADMTDRSWRMAMSQLASVASDGRQNAPATEADLDRLVENECDQAPDIPAARENGIAFGFARGRSLSAH